MVGPSGAGKSTLARLLYRFYDVSGGRITIDGQDIREVTQTSLRQAIGIVPQDTVLFNDTVAYNIAYGRPGASRAEVEAAAQAARIHDFIAVHAEGLRDHGRRARTQAVGRREAARRDRAHAAEGPADPDLRRGDVGARLRQRACDPGANCKSAARNKTALVIAHRLSTVVDAHQILVMEHGRIVERGTHAELLAQAAATPKCGACSKANARTIR